MNKKVLTLCAGFLLAGGMLSSLSAEKLSAVADNGKYYKMEEGAFISPGTKDWTQTNARGWFLDLDDTKTAKIAQNANDYWKVVSVEGGYELINFNGDKLTVNNSTVFFLYENELLNETEAEDFTQLRQGNVTWIGYNTNYVLATQDLKNGYAIAWDAVEPTTGDVNNPNLAYTIEEGVDAIRFAFNNGEGEELVWSYEEQAEKECYKYSPTNVFRVSYDKSTLTYSFIDNVTDKALIAKGVEASVKSFIVKKDAHGAYLQDPTSGKYVQLQINENNAVTGALLVGTPEEATYVGFQQVGNEIVPVDALNVLEKDGFSVSIYYDKKDNCLENEEHLSSDIADGDVFSGHLTTMTWNSAEKKFEAAKNTTSFYLKNSDGDYIVAQKYEGQGASEYQALYSFSAVKEADLKHYLIRKDGDLWKEGENEYFGEFYATVDGVDFDADPNAITKVDKLTGLYVYVNNGSPATVGRYDFTTNKVPTLVASQSTYLYPILISLGDREIVDWTTFVQDKFFTIEKVTKDAKDNGFLVPQIENSNGEDTRFEKTYGNELEGEWALTVEFADKKNTKAKTYVFTNRENTKVTFEFDNAQALYYKSGAEDTYKYSGDEYVIKAVDTDPFDGYKVLSTDKELNQTWNIAYTSTVFDGKAYLTENHNDAKDAEYHVVGLTTDVEDALAFSVKKYDGKYERKENTTTHKYEYHPADTIYVVSELGYYNTKDKAYDTKLDTLKVLAYTFVNQWNEPLAYGEVNANKDKGYRSLVKFSLTEDGKVNTYEASKTNSTKSHAAAQKFAMRLDGDNYNLRPVTFARTMQVEDKLSTNWEDEMYQIFNNDADLVKMYSGDASIGIMDNVELYDRTENDLFTLEQTDAEIYRRLANNVDTISIYRNDNEKSLLYEKYMKVNDTTSVSFLGMENIADFTKMAPAMIADTAYVRYDTYKPQYMLVVDPTIHPAGKWCDVCESADCEHAVPTPAWTEGRFLVNLVDSAKAWDEAHKHQVGNPYKNSEGYYKLGFVQATHRNDSLIVNDKKQFIGNNDNHLAKFQFRYVDTEDQSFVIETSLDGTQTPGYLKWMNGVVVVVDDIKNADVYNMNEDESRTPTANEEISADEAVKVVATNGAVIVKGAEGKNVVVSTILGKVVANEVLNSDNETIAAPAGIVVVSVDGESFKVAVK